MSFNTWAAAPPAEALLNTYLAILPDFPNSNRLAVRPTHVENAGVGKTQGWILQAGATYASDHNLENPPKMNGSWMLVRDISLDAARKRLEGDIYVTGGAWDMSKATITAVAVAKLP